MLHKDRLLFFLKTIKFIVALLVVDLICGYFANQIFNSQETGKYSRIQQVVEKNKVDVIVLGSSHAIRHYIPQVIDSILNKKSYNAGAEGQQLIYHYALQQMILKNKSPELIVMNIDEDWLYTSDIARRRLSDLYPFYYDYRDVLSPIITEKSKAMGYELLLNSYRNNSTIVHILRYYVAPQKDYSGYRPLFGKMSVPENLSKIDLKGEYSSDEIDMSFVFLLEQFIDSAKNKNVDLVFTISPKPIPLDLQHNKSFQKIKDIAKKKDVPLYDYHKSPFFIGKYELFHDASHLNNKGAKLFTEQVFTQVLGNEKT